MICCLIYVIVLSDLNLLLLLLLLKLPLLRPLLLLPMMIELVVVGIERILLLLLLLSSQSGMVIKSPTDDNLAAGGPFEGASVAVPWGCCYPDGSGTTSSSSSFLSRTQSAEFSSVADDDGLMAVTEMNLFNRLVCRGSCSNVCVRFASMKCWLGKPNGVVSPTLFFIRWFSSFRRKLNLRVFLTTSPLFYFD